MKILNNKAKKIMEVMSWTHLSNDEKLNKINRILSDAYDLGYSDGYAEGIMT